jgi:hypothetical protein
MSRHKHAVSHDGTYHRRYYGPSMSAISKARSPRVWASTRKLTATRKGND